MALRHHDIAMAGMEFSHVHLVCASQLHIVTIAIDFPAGAVEPPIICIH